ncbi:amidohydrolase family protein [Blastopirellula sp. J2-11]|uniref:amidohydrolase family protein n=1 Tax=Blastopirellula sp. J2-11 TaxID=2943192 RepID=UPI0021C67985|nr:amidohydrolase family protein [Blastopirellula sp. J2-11]UUO06194.1 amidohydrolase family protein [Blastopirellula sp. J2-11]
MKIWDMHCHLPSPQLTGDSLMEQAEQLLAIAGRVGISKLCLFLEVGKPLGPFSDDEIVRVLERYYDRLYGFVWCDLQKTAESVDLLQKWVGNGPMVGLKLGGFSGVCSRSEYAPVFEKAIDLKAVIYQHTWLKVSGNLPNESTPQDVVELAQRYPDYPFICGHSGGDWEVGIRAVTAAPNVSIGIGGFYPTSGIVESGVRQLGADRVLYGSDAPGRSFSSQLGKVLGADLPDEQKQKILYDNFDRLMQPISRAKGWIA